MALSLVLAFGPSEVAAQSTTQTAPATSGSAVEDDETPKEVIVVGSRASQQSANQRKKDARTATDSIVADDIGSFPDRNVNEAISRVPGVALQRNEFGEGDGVAIRGNGPDLTRVELDGIGVQATNNLAIQGTASRGGDLRELPAELIKSVDVVKGSTADMTEGGLGGTVQIKTRTGLDFAKPYFSLRAGTQANSLGKKWTPDFNGVASRKFFDGRVGVILSGNYQKIQNNGHNYENTTSGRVGYARLFDFDQSPEKTFSYNLNTIGTDAADAPYTYTSGGTVFAINGPDGTPQTPRKLLTAAASAQTKADCLTLFPNLAPPSGTQNTAQVATRNQRILEQQSCLNQWNDYTPSLIRNFVNTQTDQRYSFDGRVDFKASRNLILFAKGTIANRLVHDQNRSRNPLTLFGQNLTGTFTDTLNSNGTVTRNLSATAPAGYYRYDGLNAVNATLGSPALTAIRPTYGNILNVVPGSVVVDSKHNVTAMTLTNNSVTIDQIENTIDTKTKYFQGGAEWRSKRFDIDLWGGYTRASTARGDQRTNRAYTYGTAQIALQPNGLWDIDLPNGYDDTNPANYVQLRPATAPLTVTNANGTTTTYSIAQQPLTTPSFNVQYTPRLGVATEKSAKADFTYRTRDLIPFITRVKVGGQYRNNEITRWEGGGYTVATAVGTVGQAGYVPAVVVPTALVRGSFRACEPTTTSAAAGGLSCNYGFVPSTTLSAVRSGVDTLTPADLRALFERTLEPADSAYFGDLPNRGNLPPSWQGIRTDELFSALGASQFINTDCLITCVGSDGKTYAQPLIRTDETIKNVYATADFNTRLPLGVRFDGNFGVRGVFTSRRASAFQSLNIIRIVPGSTYQDITLAPVFTQTYSGTNTFKANTTDWLPSVNLNFWGFNDQVVLRLYGGKTVAQPPVDRLIPGGTCTVYDERNPADEDFDCSGRVGNPGLKPFTAWNYNASVEWYVNKDTLLSATYGTLDVKVGVPIGAGLTGQPFAGSTDTDPLTGRPLSELTFNYPSYVNGPGYKRSILEFQAKTAFTFLPWIFKYTGIDANVSILSSVTTSGQQDPLTGDIMAPPNESKYYINTSLWYDDGKFNFRVAYQKRASRFNCITPCGSNVIDINYPGEQWTNVRLVAPGYNPGVPQFIDGTTFIDAKMSYNLTQNAQIYVEGRNLTRESQTISTGGYTDFADGTPKIMKLSYGGFRVLAGASLRFGNPRGRR
ncbi:TonB-dependent receptor [uncultured Sphingomonas sp.]|uniref:TonB-dependent receptor n=2 Tax=uncultured Sphingomonas sp. TaxID=158754 RepID=UPI003748144C